MPVHPHSPATRAKLSAKASLPHRRPILPRERAYLDAYLKTGGNAVQAARMVPGTSPELAGTILRKIARATCAECHAEDLRRQGQDPLTPDAPFNGLQDHF